MSANGTSVWTGRALQAESDDLEVIGLALLYPALEGTFAFLAIMDIRAHPISFSEKDHRGRSCHRITDATARPPSGRCGWRAPDVLLGSPVPAADPAAATVLTSNLLIA